MKMALFCSTLSNESRRDYIKHTYPNIIDLDSQEDEEETLHIEDVNNAEENIDLNID